MRFQLPYVLIITSSETERLNLMFMGPTERLNLMFMGPTERLNLMFMGPCSVLIFCSI